MEYALRRKGDHRLGHTVRRATIPPRRPGARLFKPLRQTVESINQTFGGQARTRRTGYEVTSSIHPEQSIHPGSSPLKSFAQALNLNAVR